MANAANSTGRNNTQGYGEPPEGDQISGVQPTAAPPTGSSGASVLKNAALAATDKLKARTNQTTQPKTQNTARTNQTTQSNTQNTAQSAETGGYDRYLAQMRAAQSSAERAQRRQTRAAVEALESNRRSIEQDAEAAAKQAYVSRLLTEKRLPQQLRATGSSGGMTDSAVLRMNADYENSRNAVMQAKNNALADLDSRIAQVEASGKIAQAQQQSEWQRQLAQIEWQLAQEKAQEKDEAPQKLADVGGEKDSGTEEDVKGSYYEALRQALQVNNLNPLWDYYRKKGLSETQIMQRIQATLRDPESAVYGM